MKAHTCTHTNSEHALLKWTHSEEKHIYLRKRESGTQVLKNITDIVVMYRCEAHLLNHPISTGTLFASVSSLQKLR